MILAALESELIAVYTANRWKEDGEREGEERGETGKGSEGVGRKGERAREREIGEGGRERE